MRNTILNNYLPFPCAHQYRIYEDGRIQNETNGKWIRGTSITKNNRYVKVHLGADNVSKFIPLHRLVAEVFVPNPDKLPQINHKDGNRYNNSASNLEWCTAKHNVHHCWKTGMHPYNHGEEIGTSKLTADQALFIYSLKNKGLTPKQVLSRYQHLKVIKPDTIRDIWKGKTWFRTTGHKRNRKGNLDKV